MKASWACHTPFKQRIRDTLNVRKTGQEALTIICSLSHLQRTPPQHQLYLLHSINFIYRMWTLSHTMSLSCFGVQPPRSHVSLAWLTAPLRPPRKRRPRVGSRTWIESDERLNENQMHQRPRRRRRRRQSSEETSADLLQATSSAENRWRSRASGAHSSLWVTLSW